MKRHKIKLHIVRIFAGVMLFMPLPVLAQSSSSPNYQVDETFFGVGGELDQSSTNFRSRSTVGELGIGMTESALYRAYAGFNTTDEPYIEFVVTGDNIDLGYLDPAQASTAVGTFYVRAWQAGGYSVRTESDPPTNQSGSGYQLTELSSPTASSPGTEQFGINLVDNSDPDVGVDLVQSPDGTFSFGQVAPDYAAANSFVHNKGDIIAFAQESSSVTIYTVSYLFNISEITPSGQYEFRHILVATGYY
jgi:hypothetical protein